jgi:glycosyltransferase involved in cell wall biosynthesis
VTHGTRFDLIIASQIAMACYHRCFLGIPAIFEEVELGSFHPDGLEQSPLAPKIRARLRWAKFRRFMAGLLPKFICCTVASELERRLLAEAVPGYSPVHVIPNSLELNSYSMPEKDRRPGSLIFAGSLRYSANLDAMTWFLSEIYPHIRSSRGDVSLTVTGDPGPAKLTDAPGVAATGRVDDVKEWIGSAMVSVAPIRTGGGTRLKILESFALRTPVVATSKAAEGLDVRTGEHLLLADTAEEFARSVLLLLDDPERSRQMAARAFDLVRARYDWGALSREFLSLIDRAGTSSAALSQEASR